MKPQNPQTTKAIIFDSGTLISFSMSGLLDVVKNLKKIFDGKFLITEEVKKEVVDIPIKNKKYELEALRIKDFIEEKILELPNSIGVDSKKISEHTYKIMELANRCMKTDGKEIHLLDLGESSCLALSDILSESKIKNILAVDERTTRMLVENHENLRTFLERKLHIKIKVNHDDVEFFNKFKILRSTELAYVAYKKGFVEIKDSALVLDALLYSLKFKGTAISGDEIEEIKKLK